MQEGAGEAALTALFFHYARYLLLSCSREDSPLPANLQGIWNDDRACRMGWTCDFHLDVNTQMNYWPAEVCNLAECHEPVFRLVESLRAPGRRTARLTYGCRGWVAHAVTNAWGFTAPGFDNGEDWQLWGPHPTGGLWLALHLWEHYRFSGDETFLRETAFPVLAEAAEILPRFPGRGPAQRGAGVRPRDLPGECVLYRRRAGSRPGCRPLPGSIRGTCRPGAGRGSPWVLPATTRSSPICSRPASPPARG